MSALQIPAVYEIRPVAEPTIETLDVTPAMAREWLGRNTHNRNLRPRKVNQYAADMAAGVWRFTGEAIKFDRDGRLLDGQHRLVALIQADATIRLLVVRGLEPAAQEQLDQGIPRQLSDVLALRGEKDASNLGAVIRRVWEWENAPTRRSVGTGYGGTLASTQGMLDLLAAHPELRDLCRESANRAKGIDLLSCSTIAVLTWAFSKTPEPEEDIAHFFARLGDGQALVEGDPIYALRRMLRVLHDGRSRPDTTVLLALTIKTWNAFRQGRSVSQMRWRQGGASPEPFPEPV